MSKPGNSGLKRIIWAGYYSLKGFKSAWKNEAAFRQESLAMLLMIPFAFWLGHTPEQQILLLGSCILVIVAELLNSAIEATIDRISEEHHPLSGRAKDMGSAAVFCCFVIVFITWGLIGWHELMN